MKTAHRDAARAKRQQLPKFWRPPLAPATQTTLRVLQWDLLAAFTDGTATHDTLVEWIATGLTYLRMLRLLEGEGTAFTPEARDALAEQVEQVDMHAAVLQRYHATGRVGFTGPELLIARAAASVIDTLVELDHHGAALEAATWSEQHAQRWIDAGGRMPA